MDRQRQSLLANANRRPVRDDTHVGSVTLVQDHRAHCRADAIDAHDTKDFHVIVQCVIYLHAVAMGQPQR